MGCATPPAAHAPSPAARRAEPPRVASFAELAPARTRALARFDLSGVELWFPIPPFDAVGAAASRCGFDLESDRVTIDLAIADPAELRAELRGAITVEKLACMIEAPVDGDGKARRGAFTIWSLPSGAVRVATRGAIADGPGAPPTLQARFFEASKRSGSTLVAALGPANAPLDVLFTGGSTPELRLDLANGSEAEAARDLLLGSIALAQKSGVEDLDDLDVRAEGRAFIVRLRSVDLGAALSLRRHVLEAFKLPSGSMLPGLLNGDHLFALKGAALRTLTRGDVVVLRSPQNQKNRFVKRIIGVGGDHVEIQGYTIRINDAVVPAAPLTLPAFVPSPIPTARIWNETLGGHTYPVLHDYEDSPDVEPIDFQVPPGSFFVMGDNRENSFDSRNFGVVPEALIEGRAALIWASFDEKGTPLWERFGRLVR